MLNTIIAPGLCCFAVLSDDKGLHAAILALAVGVIHAAAFEVRQWFKERQQVKRRKRKPTAVKKP